MPTIDAYKKKIVLHYQYLEFFELFEFFKFVKWVVLEGNQKMMYSSIPVGGQKSGPPSVTWGTLGNEKSSLGEMRVAVVSRVNVEVQFWGKATEILYQDGVESIRHQNSNRSGLRSTFP